MAELLEQNHGQKVGPGRAPGRYAGGCVIVSHSRHENFSHTVWITFHCRGMTSKVSVASSPNLDSVVEPQQGQRSGAGLSTKAAANRVAAAASPRRPSRANRHQLNNWLADRPFRRAIADTGAL